MSLQHHLGLSVQESKYGLKLKRDQYAIFDNRRTQKMKKSPHYNHYKAQYEGIMSKGDYLKIFTDYSGDYYTLEYCERMQEMALRNFDLNMIFFQRLEVKKFKIALSIFLMKNLDFYPVTDLKSVENVSGYYLMVLDEYCQVYLGTSRNIKARIKQHWNNRKKLDRLIFGSVETSRLSIDNFRALDTTRVFACTDKDTFIRENDLIESFPDEFVCNRMDGGLPSQGMVDIEMIATRKNRKL